MANRAHHRARRTHPSAGTAGFRFLTPGEYLRLLDGDPPPASSFRSECIDCAGPIRWVSVEECARLRPAVDVPAAVVELGGGPVECWVCNDIECPGMGIFADVVFGA